jgi:N-acetylglutamate synthase-like GNAT family acetyltransferase
MSDDNFTIVEASQDEVTAILRMIAESEGWGICLEAASAWLAADAHSFFIGRINGEDIGYVCGVRYENNFGFIGCYWVYPQHRGKGFGLRLFRHAVSHLEGCNIGLCAVLKQVNNYKKFGFVDYGPDTIYSGTVVHLPIPDSHVIHIVEYDESMLEAIATYDRQVFPSPRKSVLRELFKMQYSATRVYIENGSVRGYAVLHAVHPSHEVGPCIADNKDIGRALVISLGNLLPEGDDLKLTTQSANPQAGEFIAEFPEYGWKKETEFHRMYTGGLPKTDVTKLWSPVSIDTG